MNFVGNLGSIDLGGLYMASGGLLDGGTGPALIVWGYWDTKVSGQGKPLFFLILTTHLEKSH